MSALVDVKNLTLRFQTDEGVITAIEDLSFSINQGEVLGLVGESGSGKSVAAKTLMRLMAKNAQIGEESCITLHSEVGPVDVLSLRTAGEMRIVRGGAISMIFQEPMASFAPALSIGAQMLEQLRIHGDISKARAKEISIEMLDRVGISDPALRFGQYAFELSGGMRQRAMIATALSTKPKLLIADEPTTALDVTLQEQVLDLMKDLISEFGMGVLFITHDLSVIAQTADRVAVMYLGRIVEEGPVRQVIGDPRHPYTQGLIKALPRIGGKGELTPISGDIPSPLQRPGGCVFHPRCSQVFGPCAAEIPSSVEISDGHSAACHLYLDGDRK
jgi:oligopeptide/dipeptide ABC transporter ATP-binding protein